VVRSDQGFFFKKKSGAEMYVIFFSSSLLYALVNTHRRYYPILKSNQNMVGVEKERE
jgi:hypothetical protein